MAEHVVKVRRIEVTIFVAQRSKSVWIASGTGPTGKVLNDIKGRSEGLAAKAWRDAAEYHHY